MKKAYFLSAFIWCLLALAACGKTDDGPHYYEIRVESGQLEELESGQFLLGQQYYQGEPVSIIAQPSEGELAGIAVDVYIRPMNGEMKLLMSGVSMVYRVPGWYLDEKGNCYVKGTTGITRLDADGKMLYQSRTDDFIQDICCLEGGRVILLTIKDGIWQFWELDSDTGEIARMDNASMQGGMVYIGAWRKNLMILDTQGFWQMDLKKGTKELVLSFEETLYYIDRYGRESPVDFRVDGSEAGIIWSTGKVEQLERREIDGEREIITFRGDLESSSWLKDQINLFNQSNDSYYVVIEEPGEGVNISDFRTETNLKLALGEGADIICSLVVDNDVSGLIEKGVFADLAPMIEASGLREEDYFPTAFDPWRDGDKIYGIVPNMTLWTFTLDKEVLNGREELTIETLLDSMLEFEEDRNFFYSVDGEWILEYFLQGSGNLWGMVDWGKGTCDFSGELFSKMLRAAKRYAGDERHQYPAIVASHLWYNLYDFDTTKALEAKNQINVGLFFDDGHHAEAILNDTGFAMGLNANSEHLEGAWELFEFLLGEAQAVISYGDWVLPVNKEAFDRLAQKELEYGETLESYHNGKLHTVFIPGRYGEVVTEDMVEEMRQMLSDARCLPYKVKPLIAIIKEEASYYFNDAKDMEQVIDTIQNRVQLYLDERKTGR